MFKFEMRRDEVFNSYFYRIKKREVGGTNDTLRPIRYLCLSHGEALYL